MKRYKLLKDLPTFKAGEEFHISPNGNLVADEAGVAAYVKSTLKKFPNILEDWFEEIEEEEKGPWVPKCGDVYFYLDTYGASYSEVWTGHESDYGMYKFGNCFETSDAAERVAEWLKAFKILREDMKGFKAVPGESAVYVYYDGHRLRFDQYGSPDFDSPIRFATEGDAKESIKNHEKEWRIFLGVEE